MGIETARNQNLLYHLTKLSNLESIIEHGMLPRRKVIEQGLGFEDIADAKIISKRQELGLDSYTPFHFHPYSAFDVAVKNTYRNEDMIYLCITRRKAQHDNYKILPKHPLSVSECQLYNYDEGFEKIDWETLQEKNRHDSYAKQVKMAECLTDKTIYINEFYCMYVKSDIVKDKVIKILNDKRVVFPPPHIYIQEVWFKVQEERRLLW